MDPNAGTDNPTFTASVSCPATVPTLIAGIIIGFLICYFTRKK